MVPVRAVTAPLLHPLGEVQYETHSLDVEALTCQRCNTPMVVLAFLTDPAVVKRILDHLKLPSASPPLAPARGPVELDDMFFEDVEDARFTDLATDPWPEKAQGHARSPP